MILAVLAVCSILNCIYIENVTKELLRLESEFPQKDEDGKREASYAIENAEALWESAKERLLFVAKASYVNAITNALNNTRDFYENGSSSDYLISRSNFTEAVMSMRYCESLSIFSVI